MKTPPERDVLLAAELDARQLPGQEHHHMANEFLLTLSGEGEHQTAWGSMPFGAGDLTFFPRGQMHAHHRASDDYLGWSVRFRDDALSGSSSVDAQAVDRLNFLKLKAYGAGPRLGVGERTLAVLRELFAQAVQEHTRQEPGYGAVLKGIALQAIILIGRDPAVAFRQEEVAQDRGILRVLQEMEADPARTYDVAAMAERACMSRSHFHAMFRRLTGSTFLQHLTRLRVIMARRLLLHSHLPVLEVGMESGFASTSRFYAAFRAQCGLSPARFRAAHRQHAR